MPGNLGHFYRKFRLCKGLQQATAMRWSDMSCLKSNTPSCALGSGTAPWACAARRPSLLWRPGQQAAHAWPARQRGRALYRALALPISRLLPPSEPDSHTGLCRFPTRCWAVVGPDKGSAIIAVMLRSCTECYLEDAHLLLDTLCAEHCFNVCVSMAFCLSLHLARSLVAVCARSKHGGLCCSWASFCLARQLWLAAVS